jgi:hypothetical protein
VGLPGRRTWWSLELLTCIPIFPSKQIHAFPFLLMVGMNEGLALASTWVLWVTFCPKSQPGAWFTPFLPQIVCVPKWRLCLSGPPKGEECRIESSLPNLDRQRWNMS